MSNVESNLPFHAPVTYPLPAKAGPTTIAVASDGTVLLVMQLPITFGANPKYEFFCTVGQCANGTITFDYAPSAFFHQTGAASGLDVAMNDQGHVVLVFSDGEDLWSVTGLLGANRYIRWNDAVRFDGGDTPAVAISNSGTVVEAHRSQNDASQVFYHRGAWFEGALIGIGGHGKDVSGIQVGSLDSVSAAINSSGQIVIGFSGGEYASGCRAISGQIEGTKVKWFDLESQQYAAGDGAKVSIDERGRLVATYLPDGNFIGNKDIRYVTATLAEGSTTIDYDQEARYPVVAEVVTHGLSPLGNYVVLLYQTSAGAYFAYADR